MSVANGEKKNKNVTIVASFLLFMAGVVQLMVVFLGFYPLL